MCCHFLLRHDETLKTLTPIGDFTIREKEPSVVLFNQEKTLQSLGWRAIGEYAKLLENEEADSHFIFQPDYRCQGNVRLCK